MLLRTIMFFETFFLPILANICLMQCSLGIGTVNLTGWALQNHLFSQPTQEFFRWEHCAVPFCEDVACSSVDKAPNPVLTYNPNKEQDTIEVSDIVIVIIMIILFLLIRVIRLRPSCNLIYFIFCVVILLYCIVLGCCIVFVYNVVFFTYLTTKSDTGQNSQVLECFDTLITSFLSVQKRTL